MKKTLIALMATVALGCGAEPPKADVYSPKYGITVAVHKYNPNLDFLDLKYEAVTQCLGYTEEKAYNRADTFVVEIKGIESFWCGKKLSKTGRCNGIYDMNTNTIMVRENLNALGHELVHHLTGTSEGTDILATCGDGVDGLLNKEFGIE